VVSASWSGQEIVLAAEGEVRLVTPSGETSTRQPVPAGLRVATLVAGHLVTGYASGAVEVRARGADAPSGPSLEQTPSSPVASIVPGPGNTALIGFRSGLVGLWNLADGKQLASAKLNGAIEHALLGGTTLYVATSVGDHAALDLSVFTRPYCDVLREVWNEVPIVWSNGRALVQSPPANHECAVR
jgi:hypothetical protein